MLSSANGEWKRDSKMFNQLIEEYQKSAEFNVLGDNSKAIYWFYLKKLRDSGAEQPSRSMPKHVAPKQLPVVVASDVAFFSKLIRSFNGTQNQRMARRVFTTLFNWANRYGLANNNPVRLVSIPRLSQKQRDPFNLEEMEKLAWLSSHQFFSDKFKPYVAEAVVAFHTGMRPAELDNLTWDDVGEEFISIRSAKGKEVGTVSRLVRVTPGVKSSLPPRSRGLVFKSMTGKKLNKDTRGEAIKGACEAVGIKPREFYNTRRGTATEMFKRGYDITSIQRQLGHANISTTQIYIRPTMVEAANSFRGF